MNSGLYICPARRPRAARRCGPSGWRGRAPGCRRSARCSACGVTRRRRRGAGRSRSSTACALPLARRIAAGPVRPAACAAAVGMAPRQRRAGLPRRGCRAAPGVSSSRTGLPASSLSTDFDQPGVLRADPVELEAVGHAHADHGRLAGVVLQHGGRQRADPGVELVFGQLLGESLAATLPEIWGHCGKLVSWSGWIVGAAATARTVVIHSFRPASIARPEQAAAVQVFDRKGVFCCNSGFPETLRSRGFVSPGQPRSSRLAARQSQLAARA